MATNSPARRIRRSLFARRTAACRAWIALTLLVQGVAFSAQSADPNLAHPSTIVTVTLEGGHTIAGLASRSDGATALKYGVALFPGHPGILRLREEDGAPQFEMGGNFLVRSRRHWLDDETLVLVVDAPSDQWSSFAQSFRATERYGRDVAALVAEAGRRFGIDDWTFVGTSEGSVSAFHAARMNPKLARRVILTASVFVPTRNGPGLSDIDPAVLHSSLLWVHHVDDPCRVTPYRSALAYAQRSKSPLISVSGGGPATGDPCRARTAHGFVGVERPTVQAMRAWIKSGQAPSEVTP